MNKYYGKCNCATINLTCHGDPLFTQYCHCNKCREIASLSKREKDKIGYTFTAAYLTSNFQITAGQNNLEEIIRNNSQLFLCKTCHSLIYGMSLDPTKQVGIGINANNFNFPELPDSFKPVRHVWYMDRQIDMDDDLPKYKDAPKEQFGSGEQI